MDSLLIQNLIWGISFALLGAIVFSFVGLISGTSETASIAPVTLMVVLMGVPPIASFCFLIAGCVSKHITHSVPTALLGVPGDTMAVPLIEHATMMRNMGVPHIALQKMISGGILAALISVPISVGFATLLAPFADIVKAWAGFLFTVMAVFIAYTSKGKLSSVFLLLPLAFLFVGLNKIAFAANGKGVTMCFFLGIATGPMFLDLVTILSPFSRKTLTTEVPREFQLAPDLKNWTGFFPNPLKILTRRQKLYALLVCLASAPLFTFSTVGITVTTGELIKARVKSFYEQATTCLAVMNASTESTYMAEILIPLIAFGIPMTPISMGVAFPLFNAPPVFTVNPVIHNLHTLMTHGEFLFFGLLSVIVAGIIAYPLTMNYAHKASIWIMEHVGQESIISMFSGLVVVASCYEAGFVGLVITVTVAIVGGALNKYFGVNMGVQFMAIYAAPWIMVKLFGVS
jgi:putative tricarboxylic transport membrane protein